jgi:hypothetical protein
MKTKQNPSAKKVSEKNKDILHALRLINAVVEDHIQITGSSDYCISYKVASNLMAAARTLDNLVGKYEPKLSSKVRTNLSFIDPT